VSTVLREEQFIMHTWATNLPFLGKLATHMETVTVHIKSPSLGMHNARFGTRIMSSIILLWPLSCIPWHRRPSTEEVGALLSSQLMSAMEKLTANEQRLVRALQLERANHRCVTHVLCSVEVC